MGLLRHTTAATALLAVATTLVSGCSAGRVSTPVHRPTPGLASSPHGQSTPGQKSTLRNQSAPHGAATSTGPAGSPAASHNPASPSAAAPAGHGGQGVTRSAGATGAPPASNPPPGSAAVPPARHGGRSGGRSAAAKAGLPADWPQDLPVPQGEITGSTGSNGRWTVLILAAGSAAEVHRSAVALYKAAGFTAVPDSVLNKGNRQITLVVENRDHSATETNLVVQVTTR